MKKTIASLLLALMLVMQVPALLASVTGTDAGTAALAADYKLAKPVISKLTNTSTGVKITWGKVSGAKNYRIYMRRSSSDEWQSIGTTTSTSYTYTGAKSGSTYHFTVRCISASGKSSTSAYDKTGKKIKYIAKPTITKASCVSGGVKLTWGKVNGAAKYRVLMKTSSSGSWKKVADTTSTSYTCKELTSGKTYYFSIRCVTSDGKSTTSAYDTAGKKIKYIAKPTITKLANTSTGIKITWGKVTGAEAYRVLLKTDEGWTGVGDTTSTSYTYKTSDSGEDYTFSVRCINADGTKTTSYYDTKGKSIEFIAKPAIKSLANTANGIKISWDEVDGAEKYRVMRKSGSSWKTITTTEETSYTYTKGTEGTTYTFTLRAIGEDGDLSYYDTKGKSITRKPNPLIITAQPEDTWVRLNKQVNMTFAVEGGENLTYTWYHKNPTDDNFELDTGCTQSTYSISMSQWLDGCQMYCVVTDSEGNSVTSRVATMHLFSTDFYYKELDNGSISLTAYNGANTDVTIPTEFNGMRVASFGGQTFDWNTNPTSVYVPDGIEVLEYAFYYCSKMTSVRLPSDMKTIKPHTFSECRALPNISIPQSVTSIEEKAFYCCESLKTFDFPEQITSLGNSVFASSGLTSITIPTTITSFGSGIFDKCQSLTKATLPENLTAVPSAMFNECTALSSIHIPNSVTVIQNGAFSKCKSLTSITLPPHLTDINGQAFSYCSSLITFNLPSSLRNIGPWAFAECRSVSMGDLVFPNGLLTIGEQAFMNCGGIDSFTIPPSVTEIGGTTNVTFNLKRIYCFKDTYAHLWCRSRQAPFTLLD